MKIKDTKSNLSSRLLILIFVILSAGILVAGYIFYSNYAKTYRTGAEGQLSAVTDMKVGELVQWRKERLGDANLLYKNPAFSSLVQGYFEHPDDLDVQEQLRSWLTKFQAYDQYARVSLLDAQGVVRIFVPDTTEPIPRHIPQDAYQVLQSGEMTILDLHRDEDTLQPNMAILIPIFREKDSNVPLGVVVMRIDPYQYLYPLIQKWPTPSTTAETLLVRRDGTDALYLNELKFQKDTALKLRIPLEKLDIPAVQAALGHEGIMEGIDYRGVPVIADVRRIPDSPWFMVARMDTSEVYEPLRVMLWVVISLIGALLIGAGAGVGLVWRRQNLRVYMQRAEIAEALRESGEKYRSLVEITGVGVAATDSEGNLTFINQTILKHLGYSEDEVIGRSFMDFLHPEDKQRLLDMFLVGISNPDYRPTLEFRLMNKAGNSTWFYSAPIPILTSGVLTGFNAILIDITERKLADELLQKEQRMITRTEGIAHVGSWEWDIATDTVTWSNELFRIFQRDPRKGAPSFAEHPAFYHPDDMARLQKAVEAAIADGTPYELELRAIRTDGETRVCVARGIPEMVLGGRPVRLFGSLQDITERKLAEEALRESEEKYHKLVDNATEAIFVAQDGMLKFANPTSAKIMGYSHEELLSRPFIDFIHPDDSQMVAERHIQRLKGMEFPATYPFRIIRKSGDIGWMELKAIAVDWEGKPATLNLAHDITDRKLAEMELAAERQFLRRVIDTNPSLIFVKDRDDRYILANAALVAAYGTTPENIVGKTDEDLGAVPEEFAKYRQDDIEVLQTGKTKYIAEEPFTWSNGELHWYQTTKHPLIESDGNRKQLLAVSVDITERKRAEDALRESNEKFRKAFLTSPDSMAITRLTDGLCVAVNKSFTRLMEYEEGEIVGKSILAMNIWSNLADRQKMIEILKSEGVVENFEAIFLTKTGTQRHALMSAAIIELDGVTHILNTTRDITERKNIEEELEKSRQELRGLSVHLLSLREEERTLLAREIHDELGQALTALKMDLSWLSKKLPEGQGPLAEKTAYMLKLVDTTVKMVKRLSTELRPGLLDDLGLVAAIEWQAGEFQERTGIKTELSFEPDDIMVDNEQATALFRIFQEVLTNITRHAAATRIDAYLREKDGVLELSVRDNGKGIEQTMINSPKSLGLIGMRERCHHLGGTVDIRGKPGKGTTVTVNLPASEMRQ